MKTIDINERTLEQEKSDLKKTSSIVRVEAICFGILLFSSLVYNAVEYAENGISELCVALNFIFLPFAAAVIIVVVKFTVALFKEIEISDTPFRYSIADKLTGLANAVITGAVILWVPKMITEFIENFSVENSSFDPAGNVVLIGGVFFGAVLMAIAKVFALGCKLQQESDETL